MNKTSVFKKENIYTLFEMSWKKKSRNENREKERAFIFKRVCMDTLLDFSLVLAEEQMERIFFFVDAFMVLSLRKGSWGQNIGG